MEFKVGHFYELDLDVAKWIAKEEVYVDLLIEHRIVKITDVITDKYTSDITIYGEMVTGRIIRFYSQEFIKEVTELEWLEQKILS